MRVSNGRTSFVVERRSRGARDRRVIAHGCSVRGAICHVGRLDDGNVLRGGEHVFLFLVLYVPLDWFCFVFEGFLRMCARFRYWVLFDLDECVRKDGDTGFR